MVKNTQIKILFFSTLIFFLFFSGIGVMTQAFTDIELYNCNKITDASDSFLTYFGGSKAEYIIIEDDLDITDVTIDSGDNIIFTGRTNSDDYPVTTEAYQTERADLNDIFLTKVNSDISLSFSTFMGGIGNDYATCIVTDSNDNIIIAGRTTSIDFPVLTAYQDTHGGSNQDGFIAKFNSIGELLWSTYLGGSSDDWIYGICLDSEDNIAAICGTRSANLPVTANAAQSYFNGGIDVYVIRIAADGKSILYCSYLGGTSYDWGCSLAYIDDTLVLGGYTFSSDFPTKNGLQAYCGGRDVFITKIASNGSLILSSCIGGTDNEACWELAIDTQGNTIITGYTASTDFPVTENALQSSPGGEDDVFLVKLNSSDSISIDTLLNS